MNSSKHGGGMNACYVYLIDPAQVPALDPNPDVIFERGIYMNGSMTMDDGRNVTIWGFTDLAEGGGMGGGGMGGGGGMEEAFPSPPMRVRQGQVVQTRLTVDMMMYHTMHHHGIEPEFRSDGVGHISWDVNGTYIPINGVRPTLEPIFTTAIPIPCCTQRWACTAR